MTTVTVSASKLLKALAIVSPWREKGAGLLSCVHLLLTTDGLQLTAYNGSSACRMDVDDVTGADRTLAEHGSCLLTRAGVRSLKQLLKDAAALAIADLVLDVSSRFCYLPSQPLIPAYKHRPAVIPAAMQRCIDCPSYLSTISRQDAGSRLDSYPIALIDSLLEIDSACLCQKRHCSCLLP